MSTHNQSFGTKIRKIGKNKKKVNPSISQFCCIKVGYKGVYILWICYPDAFFYLFIFNCIVILDFKIVFFKFQVVFIFLSLFA